MITVYLFERQEEYNVVVITVSPVYCSFVYDVMQFIKEIVYLIVCVSQMIFDETYFLVVMVCLSHTNYTHLSTLSLFNILHALESLVKIVKMIIIGLITRLLDIGKILSRSYLDNSYIN